mmetsp:Transcript_9492/g.26623  ORF Transcript_9492/g.26623 Transcript_9492/m.26623 type:complete len:166 (+) Transcript_9492:1101-1598(+)
MTSLGRCRIRLATATQQLARETSALEDVRNQVSHYSEEKRCLQEALDAQRSAAAECEERYRAVVEEAAEAKRIHTEEKATLTEASAENEASVARLTQSLSDSERQLETAMHKLSLEREKVAICQEENKVMSQYVETNQEEVALLQKKLASSNVRLHANPFSISRP